MSRAQDELIAGMARLLRRARREIKEWRDIDYASHSKPAGSLDGEIDCPKVRRDIRRMDTLIADIDAVLQ